MLELGLALKGVPLVEQDEKIYYNRLELKSGYKRVCNLSWA